VTTVAFTPARPRGRTAWRIAASILAAAALAWGTLSLVNVLAHGEHRVARTLPARGITTVDVSTDRGSVRVIGSDRDDISMQAFVSDGLGGTDHHERVRSGRFEVDASCALPFADWCTASYTLRVPRGTNVVGWSGSGRVSVSGTTGSVDVGSQHGDLELAGLRTTHVKASADHGSVRLRFAVAPERVTADSDHGDVEVVVPRTRDSYRVEVHTDHGHSRAGVRTDPDSHRVVELRSAHGDVTIRYGAPFAAS
jgi:hypothetical protein